MKALTHPLTHSPTHSFIQTLVNALLHLSSAEPTQPESCHRRTEELVGTGRRAASAGLDKRRVLMALRQSRMLQSNDFRFSFPSRKL